MSVLFFYINLVNLVDYSYYISQHENLIKSFFFCWTKSNVH